MYSNCKQKKSNECSSCVTKSKRKQVYFFNFPIATNWTINDGEVTLFDESIPICNEVEALVDASIAAELTFPEAALGVFNTYRLYINGNQVSQSGYETDVLEVFGPNLETANLIWGGSFYNSFDPCNPCNAHKITYTNNNSCCPKFLKVRVTAQIRGTEIPVNVIPTSNVNNNIGNFQGAKGAFLRIYIL